MYTHVHSKIYVDICIHIHVDMCIHLHLYRSIHVSIYNMKCLWDFIRVCQKHARTSFFFVDVGVCTCIYMCTHVYIYVYVYIICTHIYLNIHNHRIIPIVHLWDFICVCQLHMWTREDVVPYGWSECICVRTYIYIHIYTCMHMYIYIYMYIYTCIHIYTYTYRVMYCRPVRFRSCMPATREDIVPDGWCGCICVYVHIYVHILIHIYLYMYINIHTNTCKYIYIDVYILYTCEISFLCAKSTRGRRSSWLNTRPVWSCCGVWHLFKN